MKFIEKSVYFFATGCYTGRIPFAPGTFGTLFGLIPCFFFSKITLPAAILLAVIFIFISIFIAGSAEKILKQKDPGCIVIDEVAGIIVTFLGINFNLLSVVAGFVIFRILDILKPFPIRFVEKKFSGGTGIVLDDVAAGIIGNFCLRFFLIYSGKL